MEKIKRPPAPAWLKEKWKEWGEKWAATYARTKKSTSFRWRTHQNKGRKELEKELSLMTQYHCSYCDTAPMGRRVRSTIDHFKPKTQFPLEAYKWENLFLSCDLCQGKNDTFDEGLLKPDEDSYDFDAYFDIDWKTGEIIPGRDATREDRERAQITITLFQLNDNGKPDDRLEELSKFLDMNNPDINDFPYRFFIKRGCD
ncbi:MAG: TIGR02646 family protein [bacterium]|nr:TIGR02646 family protein [bacterium]